MKEEKRIESDDGGLWSPLLFLRLREGPRSLLTWEH
jgi:hypothetical protein